jgi:hypothetical protein
MRKPVTRAILPLAAIIGLLPAAILAGSLPLSKSASIRATATVIDPFGFVPGCCFEELPDQPGGAGWVLQHPGREGVTVEVAADGETIEWISCSDMAGDGSPVSDERFTVIPAECLLEQLPKTADSCRVTVIYIDD